MNKKTVLANFFYTFGSNVLSFLISIIAIFIVPKFLGVEMYGYFQLYIFYVNYIGFFHLGWADGVYLRYGGAYYDKLNKPRMSGQFWGLFFFELLVSIGICVFGILLVSPEQKVIVVACTSAAVIIVLPRTILQYILQCTNRIQENAVVVTIERVAYLVFVILVLLIGYSNFLPVVIADLTGKLVSLLFAVYYCRDIVKSRPESISAVIKEAITNISVGIKLMFSNLASLLLLGIIRYSMEIHWDIITFGKVSLSLSVSNMLMVMVTAVSLVMFPTLRRINEDRYAQLYTTIRSILMIILLGMLAVYYPAKLILSAWLPQYADSLEYMAILFPICVFESKYSMLINTYMKTLRKENKLMLVNVCSMGLSLFLSWLTIFTLSNLDLAIFSIVVLLAFRCIFAELIITKELGINEQFNIVLEVVIVSCFIITSWFVGGITGMLLYIGSYCVYLLLKRKDLRLVISFAKDLIKR